MPVKRKSVGGLFRFNSWMSRLGDSQGSTAKNRGKWAVDFVIGLSLCCARDCLNKTTDRYHSNG